MFPLPKRIHFRLFGYSVEIKPIPSSEQTVRSDIRSVGFIQACKNYHYSTGCNIGETFIAVNTIRNNMVAEFQIENGLDAELPTHLQRYKAR